MGEGLEDVCFLRHLGSGVFLVLETINTEIISEDLHYTNFKTDQRERYHNN